MAPLGSRSTWRFGPQLLRVADGCLLILREEHVKNIRFSVVGVNRHVSSLHPDGDDGVLRFVNHDRQSGLSQGLAEPDGFRGHRIRWSPSRGYAPGCRRRDARMPPIQRSRFLAWQVSLTPEFRGGKRRHRTLGAPRRENGTYTPRPACGSRKTLSVRSDSAPADGRVPAGAIPGSP